MTRSFDVIGIGNAIIDVILPASDADLARLGIEKGVMQLVERPRSDALMAATGADGARLSDAARLVPGGSVANTLDGLGRLGMAAGFIGRVADDELGLHYISATEAAGTRFLSPATTREHLPTSRCIVMVTPDGERSMNTYLGISAELGEEAVDEAAFAGGPWLFLEGYLFDKPAGKAAFLKAAHACRAQGGQAGIALSDPFCVDRHRDDFRRLVAGPMDYVIGNVHEWQALYQTDDLDAALAQASADCGTVICTCSGDPAILIRGGERVSVPVHRVVPVDATGAGDQFAAGLIFGLARGLPLAAAGRMGCIAAAEVIAHYGARAEADVLDRFRAEGLV